MAKISKSKVTVFIGLDRYEGYGDLTPIQKKNVKEQVGEVIINGMQENLSRAVSPVAGGKYKRTLTKEYAKRKDGIPIANLQESGDLYSSMESRSLPGGVEVGIFDKSQTKKAYNHQVGDTLPRRQYLPDQGQKFKRNIETQIKRVIKEIHGEK